MNIPPGTLPRGTMWCCQQDTDFDKPDLHLIGYSWIPAGSFTVDGIRYTRSAALSTVTARPMFELIDPR